MGEQRDTGKAQKKSGEEKENAFLRWINRNRLPAMVVTILLGAGLVLLVLWGLHEFCSSGCSEGNTSIRCIDGWFCQATQQTHWWVALFTALPALLIWYWRDKNKLEDIRISQESQVTERFVEAVKLLSVTGDDNIASRIGGIYALRRIALDSKDDKPTVVRTLSAFVREAGASARSPGIASWGPACHTAWVLHRAGLL